LNRKKFYQNRHIAISKNDFVSQSKQQYKMGAWSKFPDGNDRNIDIFASFIQRYFEMCDNPNCDYHEDPDGREGRFDPGLMVRMDLRMGSAPSFNDGDKTPERMKLIFDLLKFYDEHYDDEVVLGLTISLCRLYNKEQFGIGVTTLPQIPSPLTDEMNAWIQEKICDEEEEENVTQQMREYFALKNEVMR